MRTVAKALGVLVYLVRGRGYRQGLLESIRQAERQLKVLLHVLQSVVCRELSVDDCFSLLLKHLRMHAC
uniref:Putative secreted protein n=1 Tax=Anopheles triannulatus TaxID=58253 RepID=A0A2M4B2P4_9DIPT